MIDIDYINQFKLTKDNICTLELTKEELLDINESINKNKFINNEIDYITFNFYKNKTFLTIDSLSMNEESIMNIKTFNCIYEKMLFKECYDLQKNDIEEYIKEREEISRIYLTINYELFKYLTTNANNSINIEYLNEQIKVLYGDIEIPINYYIYKK